MIYDMKYDILPTYMQDQPRIAAESSKGNLIAYYREFSFQHSCSLDDQKFMSDAAMFQILICRNEAEKCLIETSVNSLRISIKVTWLFVVTIVVSVFPSYIICFSFFFLSLISNMLGEFQDLLYLTWCSLPLLISFSVLLSLMQTSSYFQEKCTQNVCC